jgi:23S rRNA (guanosine2251-2'-O)-methyltransferase
MKSHIPKNQLVMGIHTLQLLLTHAPQRLVHVFAEQSAAKGRKGDLLELCRKHKISVSFTSFDALTKMAESDSHQSFVAHVRPREPLFLKEFLSTIDSKEKSLVLMLDQIFDPQNLGAILRSAECFGVDAVVFSKNRGSDVTPVVAKTSCGASETIPLIAVSNLADTVLQFQNAGFEAVVTLLDPEAESLYKVTFPDKTLLILGSEGEGVQPLIAKRADRKIYLPMQGKIDSLNVAQACSVVLYAARANTLRAT